MECGICNSVNIEQIFKKKGKDNLFYTIIKCKDCKVVQTYPRPNSTEKLYDELYFQKRTDRGYNQYFSENTKKVLLNTWKLNLKDLKFFNYESEIFKRNNNPKLLEIGCAGGFFLQYMRSRGWDVEGVEISKVMSELARENLKLKVFNINFMDFNSSSTYDCIVLWATIEHFLNPVEVFRKIYNLLSENGILIFSTCRWGWLAKIKKQNWRFMNVPEHLFFFNEKTITPILENLCLKRISYVTYGSGMTSKKNMSFFYKFFKTIADSFVKKLNRGDMMAMMFQKTKSSNNFFIYFLNAYFLSFFYF